MQEVRLSLIFVIYFYFYLCCSVICSSAQGVCNIGTLCVKESSADGKWRKTRYCDLIKEDQRRERMNVNCDCTWQGVYMKREDCTLKRIIASAGFQKIRKTLQPGTLFQGSLTSWSTTIVTHDRWNVMLTIITVLAWSTRDPQVLEAINVSRRTVAQFQSLSFQHFLNT